jgi:hypothetical protein
VGERVVRSYRWHMCRSIKTLRPPYADEASPADVHAAALQYVRKVVGMRQPSPRNQAAFETAVAAVAAATQDLLRDVVVRPAAATPLTPGAPGLRSS